ncbi:GNAT family N-acetyltransferase [Raineyella fluvialis]|uniref:GNAT family N-acetyltransferase n=1 Tax=Raineyella fluvialis TaxID=2662261 RepID=A0A5Q2FKM2_9ACTN|nr:GNAT family N-acetyltransferase [Raineyella fluvialis]
MSTFVHQVEGNRFEALINDQIVGTLQYTVSGKKMVIEHTETVRDFRGQGIARRLTRLAFDDARTRGMVVDPKCTFAKRFVDLHPEYTDVL